MAITLPTAPKGVHLFNESSLKVRTNPRWAFKQLLIWLIHQLLRLKVLKLLQDNLSSSKSFKFSIAIASRRRARTLL